MSARHRQWLKPEVVMRDRRHHGAAGAVLGALFVLAACQATPPSASFESTAPLAQPSWPVPGDPMTLATQAGLVPETQEFLTTHLHAHLDLFVDGKHVTIPAGVGIAIGAKGVREEMTPDGTAHSYNVAICDAPCLSPLHTHDPDGLIHEESREANHPPYTLGQFFAELGQRIDANCVAEYCRPDALIHVYLDGKAYEKNPAEMSLKNHLEIAIVIGQPPTIIPASWEFLVP